MKIDIIKSLKITGISLICLTIIFINYKLSKPSEMSQQASKLVEQAGTTITPTSPTRYIDKIFDNLDIETNIVYSEAINYKGENEKLLLDLYKPSGDSEINKPVIVWLHGGGLTNGSKDLSIFEKDLAMEFAKKGYVTLNINYRLTDVANKNYYSLKDAIEDTAEAVKWISANSEKYGIDKNKIALGGYSAGATTVINLCYSNTSVYGIDKKAIFSVINMAGGRLYTGTVQKGDPPCITIQGTNDATVPYYTSQELEKALNDNGVYNTLYSIKDCDHDLKTYYDDIVNETTKFLYKNLTGKDITIAKRQGKPHEYLKVDERLAKSKHYNVKQVTLKIDGKLDEWGISDILNLDQLKDTGKSLPDKADFSGTAMLGWNEQEPNKIYIAATVTDDTIQDINSAKTNWFNDDCLEIAFDLSQNDFVAPITKWAVGATGNDLSVLGDNNNTEYIIVKDGNTYIYEIAIDLSKIETDVNNENRKFSIKPNSIIGFSLSYNDCENNIREHQIGWVAGQASSRTNFGNLKFVTDKVA